MRKTLSALVLLALAAGCSSQPQWEPEKKSQLFAPSAMRIHPVFTQIRDWTGDNRPDGLEILVEFQDQFGDSVKAAGEAIFEVYDYRPGYPDPRGQRVAGPFLVSTSSAADQRDHWNRTSRSYIFQLVWPQVNPNRPYVINASFEQASGGRYFDTLVLEPPTQEKPVEQPATRPARP